MSDRDALLATILANPEDDLPRLVFADWLEENGYGRWAEFIRDDVRFDHKAPDAQLQLLNLENLWGSWPDEDDPRTLIREHCPLLKEWMMLPEYMVSPQVPAYMSVAVVRRGFVDELRAPLAVLMQHLPELVKREPVQKAVATDKRPLRYDYPHNKSDWNWFSENFRPQGQLDNIPIKLITLMDPILQGYVTFSTEAAAITALSDALLAHAKGVVTA